LIPAAKIHNNHVEEFMNQMDVSRVNKTVLWHGQMPCDNDITATNIWDKKTKRRWKQMTDVTKNSY